MNDKELLELAAKAAGIELARCRLENPICEDFLLTERRNNNEAIGWNPLTDDGDALRLAVKLHFDVHVWWENGGVSCAESGIDRSDDDDEWCFEQSADQYADARRAIVRAAAEIGKDMP